MPPMNQNPQGLPNSGEKKYSPEEESQGILSNDERNILEKPTKEQIAEFDAEIYEKLWSVVVHNGGRFDLKTFNIESNVFNSKIQSFIGSAYIILRHCYVKFGMKEGVKGNPGVTIKISFHAPFPQQKKYGERIVNAPEIQFNDYHNNYTIDSIPIYCIDSIDLVEYTPEKEIKV